METAAVRIPLDFAAFGVSLAALITALATSLRAQRLARQGNALPVLVQLFKEHRSRELAETRRYVLHEAGSHELSRGLIGLPEDRREEVRDLTFFYDNLGALVAHDIVDIEPVSGYLGTSVVQVWDVLAPLVLEERRLRDSDLDEAPWQAYFENLAALIRTDAPPAVSMRKQSQWRLK